jgi:phosphohistidine swiveling domain-containing protein
VRGRPAARFISLFEARDLSSVGAKAARLARLMAAAIPVPPGFVVTEKARRAFFTAGSLAPTVEELEKRLAAGDGPAAREIAAALRERLAETSLPRGIREGLFRRFREVFASRPVIVRSSGIGEDGLEASYAGILDSIPDVSSSDGLENALKACWASAWSERSLSYQLAREVRLQGMGVVVQLQIASVVSGVLFTESPNPDPDDVLVGEYCRGPGRALVSGEVDPVRFKVSRSDLRLIEHTAPSGEAAALSDDCVLALARLGLEIERLFEGPQDIEWTIDGEGGLHVVQSRPITTPTPAGRIVWSNANVSENFPGPVTPFVYSFAETGYEHYFRNLARAYGVPERRIQAADPAFQQIIGAHGARIYYNLTNIHRVLRSVPHGDWLARYFDGFVGVEKGEAERQRPAEPNLGLRTLFELAVMGVKTTRLYVGLDRRVRDFETTIDRFASRWTPERLARAPLPELLEALREIIDIRGHRWLGASLADAAAMVTSGALKALLGGAGVTAPEQAQLFRGMPDIVSARPAHELWQLSRRIRNDAALRALFERQEGEDIWKVLKEEASFAWFRAALERYLDDWGFRSSGELMMTRPSFQERPAELIDLLKPYARLETGAPHEKVEREAERRRLAEAAVAATLLRQKIHRLIPILTKATVFRHLLRWTHRSIALRERARLKQALLYSRCRRVVLAIGKRLCEKGTLEKPEDAFFLSWRELTRLLAGAEMFPEIVSELVAVRKEEHSRLSLLAPPDHFTLPRGAYLEAKLSRIRSEEAVGAGRTLSGTGAGGGRARGPAAVLREVSEGHRLKGEDVLVAPQTDPGWGTLFPLIRGLVLEKGGLLSHGAILAREFGIPSVVGVKDATSVIGEGRRLEVDGDSGLVVVLD